MKVAVPLRCSARAGSARARSARATRSALTVALGLFALSGPAAAAPIKVAVIGPQHVHSHQLTRDKEFPAMLQTLLGSGYIVGNFGDCCASILRGYPKQPETHPYLESGEAYPAVGGMNYKDSLKFMPDIVLIAPFGKHDRELSMQMFGGKLDQAKETMDYEALVKAYLDLPQHPKVYASTPIPIPFGSPDSVVTTALLPACQAVIDKYHLPYVDFHAKFLNHKELFKDDTHLTNDTGLHLLADSFYALMKAQDTDGGVPADAAPEADAAGEPPDAAAAVDAAPAPMGGSGGSPSATGGNSGTGTGGSGSGGGGKSGTGTGSSGGKGGTTAPPDDAPETPAASSSGCAVGAAAGRVSPGLGVALLLGLAVLLRRRRR